MKSYLGRFALIFGILALFSNRAYATTKTVGGQLYEQVSGVWFLVDGYGDLWEIAPDRIEIRFLPGTLESVRDDLATTLALDPVPIDLPQGYFRFTYAAIADPIEVLEDVIASPSVEVAHLDTYLQFQGAPNDPYYGATNQWNLLKMDLERAWDVTTGNSPMTIAILDQGIDRNHEDLAATRWTNPSDPVNGIDEDAEDELICIGRTFLDDFWGWDFIDDDNEPLPLASAHGTAAAGMACAARDNSTGIASISGGSQSLRPIKWLSFSVNTTTQQADAIRYCRCKGIKIISMSFVGTPNSLVGNELRDFASSGGLLFGGSGNGCGEDVRWPASHDSVIAVGATGPNDVRWDYSNYGPALDLVAPSGEFTNAGCPISTPPGVWSTDNPLVPFGANSSYNPTLCLCPPENELYVSMFGGTSAACPQAAAVAALVWSHRPGLTNGQVRQILQRSARDLGTAGRDDQYGYGRIDAYRALTKWGTITSSTTWGAPGTPSTIYVSGDLTVAPGATLTILPGTMVKVASDDNESAGADHDKIEFNVEGTLLADGTAANPIRFESWTPTTTQDWVGFYFDAQSGGGTFDNCRISRAEYAIESYKPLIVKNTTIEDCQFGGILVHGGSTLVQACTIRRAGTYGVRLKGGSTTIRNTVIDDAAVVGCQVESSATLTARNSQFTNSDKGLYVLGAASSVSVDTTCIFSGNTIGIHCHDTNYSTSISRSTVQSNSVDGVLCASGSRPPIQQCQLVSNYVAVYCSGTDSSPALSNNLLNFNTGGVNADVGANPDLGNGGSYGSNAFLLNTGYHVANANAWTVMAKSNYWNSSTPPCFPKASKIIGPVDYNPALCSNPNPSSPMPEPGPSSVPIIVRQK